MYLQALPTLLAVLVLVFLGLIVVYGQRKLVNNLFMVFGLVDSLWLLSVFAVLFTPLGKNPELSRAVFAIAVALMMSVQAFTNTLLQFRHGKFYSAYIYGYGLVVLCLTLGTPLIIKNVQLRNQFGASAPYPQYGSLYVLFLAYILPTIFIYFFQLLKAGKRIHEEQIKRRQLHAVSIGLAVFAIGALSTNLVLPSLLANAWPAEFAPIGSLVLAISFFYAIGRYKLFDIRFFAVRAVAYLTTLSVVILLFVVPLILLMLYALGTKIDTGRFLLILLASGAALALLQRLREIFDKITAKFFFRHYYDPQAFLDELNKVLVSTIELERLLKVSAQIIADNLKAEYCLFGIKETGFKEVRIMGTTKKEFKHSDILLARQSTPRLGTNVVITDYIPPEAVKLRRVLDKNDIAVLVRLVPDFESSQHGLEGLGYIMLGRKRNGSMYNSRDVKILGIIANELVIAIQNALHFEEIQRFNVTLQEQVEVATRKLRRTNQRLRELDETKDDFISMASHQLRTPLTSVKGYLSLVLEGDAGKLNETQAKMLRQAFSSSQRMVFLITDLLNISRLKTGKFVIETTPVDLSALVQEEVEQLHESAEIKQITLSFTKPAAFPKLMLDETKVRQVIMNYIDNALYYTPVGGKVAVELTEKPATVELRVVDSGIGVPKAEQPHLFTKFYRATNARKARPDGTGLGLFMAKKAITAQGGSIVFSSHEGHGSTFGFVFSKTRLKVPENISAVQHSLTAQIDADVAADKKRQKQPA